MEDDNHHHPQVGIIGAGISGLLACKYVLSKGFRPVVFESRSSIGGVWLKTTETTKLQTARFLYRFSDFPWPPSVTDDFPSQHQTLDYIESYARHFDLLKHIRFNSKVTAIDYDGPAGYEIGSWSSWGGVGELSRPRGTWLVSVEDSQSRSIQVYELNFVILCVGRFNEVTNIPEFPAGAGPEAFDGEVIHSSDYAAMDYASAAQFIKGKKIIIVGSQKSALDIAHECSIVNGVEYPCTMLFRKPHWNVPDYYAWGVSIAYFYLNRFGELTIHKPNEGFLLSFLATVLSPIRWAFSKFVETYVKWKLPLAKHGMVPKHSFLQDLSSCLVSLVPEGFYDRVEKGSIVLKKSPKFSFCGQGIVVDGEAAPLETDLVIFATGFNGAKKLRDIFVSPTLKDYISASSNARIPLYRECIHPRIPLLAIIGFSESVSNLYTSELRCRWVAELLEGSFKLPSVEEMEKDVEKWEECMKKYSKEYYKRSCIGPLQIWYNDQLCKDIGWNPRRKKGFFAEMFDPYGPMDYASLDRDRYDSKSLDQTVYSLAACKRSEL